MFNPQVSSFRREFSSPEEMLKALREDEGLRDEMIEYLVKYEHYDNCDAVPFIDAICNAGGDKQVAPEMKQWVAQYWKVCSAATEIKKRQRNAIERQREIDNAARIEKNARTALEVEKGKIAVLDAFIASTKETYMSQFSGVNCSASYPRELLGVGQNLAGAERCKELISSHVIPQIEAALKEAEAVLHSVKAKAKPIS